MTGGCEDHAEDAQRHAANRTLKSDVPHPAADVRELVHLLEGNRASQILAKQEGRNDGDSAQQVGTKLAFQEFPKQVIEKWNATEGKCDQ